MPEPGPNEHTRPDPNAPGAAITEPAPEPIRPIADLAPLMRDHPQPFVIRAPAASLAEASRWSCTSSVGVLIDITSHQRRRDSPLFTDDVRRSKTPPADKHLRFTINGRDGYLFAEDYQGYVWLHSEATVDDILDALRILAEEAVKRHIAPMHIHQPNPAQDRLQRERAAIAAQVLQERWEKDLQEKRDQIAALEAELARLKGAQEKNPHG